MERVMLYQYRQKLFSMLDTPLGRPILALLGSLYRTVAFRHPAFVWCDNGQWVHKEADGFMVERQIMLHPIRHFHALTTDFFMYSYRVLPGDVVIDCGAFTGWETLLFSKQVGPTGRVIAIEAHPVSFACLTEMCRRNHLTNVVPLHCAVSDTGGTAYILDSNSCQANSIVAGGEGIAVPTRTIDEITKELGIERIDLIKMNIEGAETAALRGAPETLRITRHVAVSCHDFLADEGGPARLRTKADVRSLLEEIGFKITTRSDEPGREIKHYLYADRELVQTSTAANSNE
jgi:FkbM family methyltransferase